MVGFLTQLGPKQYMSIHQSSRVFVRNSPRCFAIINGELIPALTSVYTKPTKEEKSDLKMPGFIQPESMYEEGHFTQKAKQQLEELKKREATKNKVSPPETKV